MWTVLTFYAKRNFPKKEAIAIAHIPLFPLAIQPYDTSTFKPIESSHTEYVSPMRYLEGGIQYHSRITILYNIQGDAAEWLEDPNLAVDGSWHHNVKYVMLNDTICSKANA